MEKSEHLQETIALGKKLIEEFSTHSKRNTTLRWMGHYLAELIKSAEIEKIASKRTQKEKEIVKLILDIWKARPYFPKQIGPLSGLAGAVEVIKSLEEPKKNEKYWGINIDFEKSTPWGKFATTMRKTSKSLYSMALLASVSHETLLKEKEWAKFPNLLSEDEKTIIGYIDDHLSYSYNRIQIVVTSSKPDEKKKKPDRIDKLLSKIEKSIEAQKASFDELKKSIQLLERDPIDDEIDDDEDRMFNDFMDD